MLIAGLCIAGVVAAFVFVCMICHAGKLSDREFHEKQMDWMKRGEREKK